MNGYSQDIPQVSEFNLEPPTMPYNLSRNILDPSIESIPIKNPEFSKECTKAYKDSKIEPVFKDRNLILPTHISVNHAFLIPDTE
mmetsp:Transcript_27148/g.24020  ORF Transcript_27148/g.24020 Transcript_27148/m.24020 type:complete len:85 (+) Transcript_27148:544-798(+)